MAKSSHLSGLGVALLERLILSPEGLMLSSLPDPMMRGTALAECRVLQYVKLVENPLLKDAKRRCRKEKRKGWISGESFDDPLPECRLLKITNRGIVFLQHHPGKTPKPPTGAKGVALRDAKFLEWYEDEGSNDTYHSHAGIRDKWNGLSLRGDEGQEKICPTNPKRIEGGEKGRQTVIQAIKRAKAKRQKKTAH